MNVIYISFTFVITSNVNVIYISFTLVITFNMNATYNIFYIILVVSQEANMVQKLLSKYDKHIKPTVISQTPMEVIISFGLTQIQGIVSTVI